MEQAGGAVSDLLARLAVDDASEDDPVVAFLKREAERRISQPDPAEGDGEPPEKQSEPREPSAAHATVRSVLDRMGQPVRHD